MVILGVDPGSIRTGWGAIRSDGRRHHLVDKGVIAPPPRAELPARLRYVHAGIAVGVAIPVNAAISVSPLAAVNS